MHSIGERLKEERKRLGFSQTKLCVLTGITRKTLFSYETNERSPNALFLAALYEYDFDVDYILKGSQKKFHPLLLKRFLTAAESAFQMIQSADITVTPAQFAQMLGSLMITPETDNDAGQKSGSGKIRKKPEKKIP